jgi:ATP-binding cassette subfamily C protein CydD
VQPANALAALAPLQREIKFYQYSLVITYTLASIALWVWFYQLSGWLDALLMHKTAVAFPWPSAIILIVTAVSFYGLNTYLRFKAAHKISTTFYRRYFAELNERRWALIRSKPTTAWQDIAFRHLPTIEQYLLDYLPQRQLLLLIPMFVLGFVFPLSWMAALILFTTLPLIPLFMWLVGHGTVAAQNKHLSSLNKLGAFFSDRVMGTSTVRTLGAASSQLHAFDKVSHEQNRRLADVVRLAFLSGSVLDFFSTVSMALVAVFIGFSLLGELNFGFWGHEPTLHSGLFILTIAPAFFSELKKLGKLYHVKAEASASASQWHHTLTWTPLEGNVKLDEPFESLAMNKANIVGFDQEHLLDITALKIQKNDCIHITGRSGSGKTVLLDALAGLREITVDAIRLNGSDVKHLKTLQQSIFYVGQQPVFFEGTVFENIGLNQFDADAVKAAIERVGMTDWLNQQPEALDTELDEHIQLSGGQKQKLALARLVLFDTQIVLLDEPLAHLSQDEQTSVLSLLQVLTEKRTSIWISHKSLPPEMFNQTWIIEDKTLVVSS